MHIIEARAKARLELELQGGTYPRCLLCGEDNFRHGPICDRVEDRARAIKKDADLEQKRRLANDRTNSRYEVPSTDSL